MAFDAVLDAIRENAAIACAAVTGSLARDGAADCHSDLDCLVIASGAAAVRDVRSWLPDPPGILIAAFHLTNYCSILLDTFEKIDLAIFAPEDSPSRWVVTDYRAIKGGAAFEEQLVAAVAETRGRRAAHRNPDVSLDNVLLLLATALHRVRRGEQLSAHAFVAMAADMIVGLERREHGEPAGADLLDVRRRIERSDAGLAGILQRALFAAPDRGIAVLTEFLAQRVQSMTAGQARALELLAR